MGWVVGWEGSDVLGVPLKAMGWLVLNWCQALGRYCYSSVGRAVLQLTSLLEDIVAILITRKKCSLALCPVLRESRLAK